MKMKSRRRLFGTGEIGKYRLINFLLVLILSATYIYAFSSIEVYEGGGVGFRDGITYYVFQFVLVTISLILITTLGYALRCGFGAVARMETILKDVAAGSYSLRLSLRKGDILSPLADKVNRIIDLLEKSAKQ